MTTAVVAIVLTNKDNQILLGRRLSEPYRGELCTPGGKVDVGETIKQCTIRELKEETSLECTGPITNIMYHEDINDDHHYIGFANHIHLSSCFGIVTNTEPTKNQYWSWFDFREVMKMKHIIPGMRKLSEFYLADFHQLSNRGQLL